MDEQGCKPHGLLLCSRCRLDKEAADRIAALSADLAAMTRAYGVAKCMHIAETQATEQVRADLAAAQAERDGAFKKGVKAFFDYLLIRAANNYHFNAEKDAEREKYNVVVRDWADDALADLAPDYHVEWRSLTVTMRERDEARADAVALREQYGRLCDIFRVNMLRAFPDKSHAEIDAAIDAARKEGGNG